MGGRGGAQGPHPGLEGARRSLTAFSRTGWTVRGLRQLFQTPGRTLTCGYGLWRTSWTLSIYLRIRSSPDGSSRPTRDMHGMIMGDAEVGMLNVEVGAMRTANRACS